LNTSTLRPFQLDPEKQILVAGQAGFAAVELWVRDLQAYLEAGGRLERIRQVAEEAGVSIVNGIAFFKWTDAAESTRRAGLRQAEREISLLSLVGCSHVAAPPTGNVASMTPERIGQNFGALLELSRGLGVEPILEFWGRAPVLHSIAETNAALQASGDGQACGLLDLFHMYTGGSTVDEVSLLRGRIGLVHINDYPSSPSREVIRDSDRVMPGDGVGPVRPFLKALAEAGFTGPLSVELFRDSYDGLDAAGAALLAARKTRAAWEG
jgi:sugar phosphate isomerase/epimerase